MARQVLAEEVLEHQERAAVGQNSGVEIVHDTRVLRCAAQLDLPEEAGRRRRIGCAAAPKNLEHALGGARRADQENFRGGAVAQLSHDFILKLTEHPPPAIPTVGEKYKLILQMPIPSARMAGSLRSPFNPAGEFRTKLDNRPQAEQRCDQRSEQ